MTLPIVRSSNQTFKDITKACEEKLKEQQKKDQETKNYIDSFYIKESVKETIRENVLCINQYVKDKIRDCLLNEDDMSPERKRNLTPWQCLAIKQQNCFHLKQKMDEHQRNMDEHQKLQTNPLKTTTGLIMNSPNTSKDYIMKDSPDSPDSYNLVIDKLKIWCNYKN